MSDLLLLNKKLRKSEEGDDHVAKMRNNRVNFSAQYIRVVNFMLSRTRTK